MSNRAGQFVLPFGAGLVAAATGPGRPVRWLLAAAIVAAAAAMAWLEADAQNER